MPEVPQGWYPDPHTASQQRWWDGTQWTGHTAPFGHTHPSSVTSPAKARSSKTKVALISVGILLVAALVTRSLGMFLLLTGCFLFFVSIYALVRGSAKLFHVRSRGHAWAALAIAFVLMFVGTGANAALGGPGSNANDSTTSSATTEPRSFVATETTTPSPTPKPTTVKDLEESSAIPFQRTIVDDPQIDVGESVITVAGTDGTKVTTYRVTYVDGKEVSRELVSEVVTVDPVDEVTSNGTRQPVPEPVPVVQPPSNCHTSYSGVCVPIASDVDCEGGSGDGPAYVRGPLQVVGPDVYDLDRDGDGIACDK